MIKGEKPIQYSFLRNVYVKVFNVLQHLVAGGAVGAYDEANRRMLEDYRSRVKTDGELIFLAADPDIKGKGTGTIQRAVRAYLPERGVYKR